MTKQQVNKANQDKNRANKQKRAKNLQLPDEAGIKAKQAAEKKARRDRELNRRKEEQARQKAVSIEINQLIETNCLQRGESCNIAYNFEHQGKVRRIYVDSVMKQQIIAGRLSIARIEGRYELVPLAIAEKILQRNEKRIVIIGEELQPVDENDPYADYKVPDDLTW